MRARVDTRLVALLALVAAGAAFGITRATESRAAGPVTYELCATTGTATLTTGVDVDIWGFGIPTTPGDCSTATATLPGPVLDVNEGDVVTLTIHNGLPAGHTLALEIPGVSLDAGLLEAAVGDTLTASFTASAPGTYVYQSGGDAGRQEAMGLAGALIVRPATAGRAYGNAASAYDVESTLVLGAVDPAFNAAPDTFDLNDYRATYWLVNGKAYEAGSPGITAAPGQRLLLRYVNAGYDNTALSLLGLHERVIARDASLLGNPVLAATDAIPAGGTADAIVTVPSTAPPSQHGFPLFNRNLHVTDGTGATYDPVGGMLVFIHS